MIPKEMFVTCQNLCRNQGIVTTVVCLMTTAHIAVPMKQSVVVRITGTSSSCEQLVFYTPFQAVKENARMGGL
jgi:hypothetical protein